MMRSVRTAAMTIAFATVLAWWGWSETALKAIQDQAPQAQKYNLRVTANDSTSKVVYTDDYRRQLGDLVEAGKLIQADLRGANKIGYSITFGGDATLTFPDDGGPSDLLFTNEEDVSKTALPH